MSSCVAPTEDNAQEQRKSIKEGKDHGPEGKDKNEASKAVPDSKDRSVFL